MKTVKTISEHPFIFLTGLVLIASFCSGGFLFLSGRGAPGSSHSISGAAPAVTIQDGGAEGVTNTPAGEIQATALPERPTTAAAAPTPEATATSIPVTAAPADPAGPLVVSFIDVGQGDSILVEAPDGKTALIDGGSAGSGALAFLQDQGIKSIDIMIATHPDEDHIGGLVEVLNAMPVKEVITNGQSDTTTTYQHLLDALDNAGADLLEAARGDTIPLGSLTFSVLSPAAISAEDQNANSLVLRMAYEKTTFMLMGDADRTAEAGILAAGLPVRADILKVGHHGGCESSSPAFLDAVQPVVAVYSAGFGNPYGLPCADTISALNQRSIFVFGTNIGGGGSIMVTVTADGYSISNSSGLIFRR